MVQLYPGDLCQRCFSHGSCDCDPHIVELEARIEQLERELENTQLSLIRTHSGLEFYREASDKAATQLAAEKVLADDLFRDYPYADDAYYAYRKARGL